MSDLPAIIDPGSAASFRVASRSDVKRRAYRLDVRDFVAWCDGQGAAPLPAAPRIVASYLTHLAGLGRSVSTINRRAAVMKPCINPVTTIHLRPASRSATHLASGR